MAKPVVLISDKLAPSTIDALGDTVEVRFCDGTNKDELLEAVKDANALLVRSATTVDKDVLTAGKNLKIVARAGVGIDNVDVKTATSLGVMVVNAPTSNIHSAAEHAIALLLSVARQIPQAHMTMQNHEWKRNSFLGVEIYGKTIGVIGLGRIGQLVAKRLLAFEANVIAYDPYISAAKASQIGVELVTLDELLTRADAMTIHLPKTPETAGMISTKELAKVKQGVIIVNDARGGLIDEAALAQAVSEGKVKAGIDVYDKEPYTQGPLIGVENIVLTPHLGASTAEAQDRAGTDVAASVLKALSGQFVSEAVNVSGGIVDEHVSEWIDLTKKLGCFAGILAHEIYPSKAPVKLEAHVFGELSNHDVDILSIAALCGFGSFISEEPVTFVNAPDFAKQKGIEISSTSSSSSPAYRSFVDVVLVTEDGKKVNVSGTLTGNDRIQKIVNINGRNIDLRAQGHNLLVSYEDAPGMLGKISTILGDNNIDIQAAAISHDAQGSGATTMLRLDQIVSSGVKDKIREKIKTKVLVEVNLD